MFDPGLHSVAIAVREFSESLVELKEEFIQPPRIFAKVLRLQQQGAQSGSQGQGYKGGDDNGNGDGDGKLLVKAADDTRYKTHRYEYRRQDQGYRYDRPANIGQGFGSSLFGRQAFCIYIVLHGFHHHDGVIDHDTDGQHEAEHGKGIDGKAQRYKKYESSYNGDGDRQHRDQGRPPVLQKEEYDDRHKQQGDQQGIHHIGDGNLYDGDRLERNHIIDIGWEIGFHGGHGLVNAFRGGECVAARSLVDQQVGGPFAIHE